LNGVHNANVSDVFNGSITFDTDVAPDMGDFSLVGIVAFDLSFTGSHNVDFDLSDLTGVYWFPISGDLLNGGLPWIAIGADNGTQTLSASNYTYQMTSFNGNYNNVSAKKVDVPEPTTLAIFALGMIGLASRRLKKKS
jgi:hypothetical protein